MTLQKGAHIHMLGICGTAMGGLAGLLKELGYKVTGSDQNVYPPMSTQLKELGIEIKEGYKKENLTPRPDFVIVGNVMTKKHEEVQALLETDIPYTSLPDAIGKFIIENRKSIVITGTHGKTTTTAMMAWVAKVCEQKPGFLVGGRPLNFDVSFELPKADTFVIEGDEYDTAFFAKVPKFLFYKPTHVVLTSVEFDHADIYADFEAVKKSFYDLLKIIPKDGLLVAFSDDQGVREVVESYRNSKIITYGLESGDYQAKNIKYFPEYCQFDVFFQNKKIDDVKVLIFGKHNVANALSCYVMAKEMGWDLSLIKKGLETYKGVKRRQEVIGKPNNITIIEDFAHHPTAVKVTIESISERFKDSHLFAVFEPRSATSRRKVFQKEYVKAFSGPWTSIFAKPFNQTNINESDRFSSDELVSDLKAQGNKALLFDNVDLIVEYLKQNAKPKDVILIMSNGGFDGIYQKLLNAL